MRSRPASRCRRGFYLGFEQYRGSPPDTAATPLLNVQLDNISNLVTLLIKTRIDKLNSIKRAPLPQEGGAAAPTPAPGRPNAAAAANAKAVPELVSKQVLEIAFTTLPGSFRDSLNSIVKDKRLYIVRAVEVKNQVRIKARPRDVADAGVPGGRRGHAARDARPDRTRSQRRAQPAACPKKVRPHCATSSARKSSTWSPASNWSRSRRPPPLRPRARLPPF